MSNKWLCVGGPNHGEWIESEEPVIKVVVRGFVAFGERVADPDGSIAIAVFAGRVDDPNIIVETHEYRRFVLVHDNRERTLVYAWTGKLK